MYTTSTAENFNLKHFMQVFTSSSCGVCNEGDRFAVTFCLVRCCRVRQDFRVLGPHQRCLPTEMAIECFGLEYQEMVQSKGLARAQIPPVGQLQTGGDQLGTAGKHYHVIVISLEVAFDIAISKYKEHGDMGYVKVLANDYLMEHNIEFEHDEHAADVVFPGFSEGERMCWRALGIDLCILKHLLLTSLPYLHPRKYPAIIESGSWFQGCLRNTFYGDKDFFYERIFYHLEVDLHASFESLQRLFHCSIYQPMSLLNLAGRIRFSTCLEQDDFGLLATKRPNSRKNWKV
jgi:hypothetical protein